MSRRPRRNHSHEFKAKVALAASIFGSSAFQIEPADLKPRHAKIDQLTLENDFLETALTKAKLLGAKR